MNDIQEYMTRDHRECDAIFASLEEAVSKASWEDADLKMKEFLDSLNRHLEREERILFPAQEAAAGTNQGPTQVMRYEHEQMRGLLEQAQAALQARDSQLFAGHAETLHILMQQHNMKEEQVLYPMTDRLLGGQAADLVAQMSGI